MKLLHSFLLVTIFLLGIACTAQSAQQVVKVGFNAKENNIQVTAFRDVFIPYVEKATNGKYKFELFPGGVLGASRQRIQQMRNGMVQMSVETTANLSQFAPLLSMLDMPYLFKNREDVNKLFKSDVGKELLDPITKNLSLRPLAAMMCTFRLFAFNQPGRTLEELKGMKLRTANSKEYISTINSLGFTATPMPHSEAFTGIQQKVINGLNIDTPAFQEDHFYEVANNIIKADQLPVIYILCINNNFFNKMPQEDQQAFIKAAELYVEKLDESYEVLEEKSLKEMAEIPGVTVYKLTEEEKDEWRKASMKAFDILDDKQMAVIEKIREVLK